MQIWAESGKSALPICNYSQILYQFLTFTQNLKRSRSKCQITCSVKYSTIFFDIEYPYSSTVSISPNKSDFAYGLIRHALP